MRPWYRNLDYLTLLIWFALVAIGLVAIYSTTHGPTSEYLLESVRRNFLRQVVWVGISFAAVIITLMLPVHRIREVATPIYLLTLALLVIALLFGREINGARSWLHVGGMSLQVSELAKVGAVIMVAQILSFKRNSGNTRWYAIGITATFVIPGALIVLQNDTGTALVFIALVPIVLLWSVLPPPMILLIMSPAVTGYLALLHPPTAIACAIACSIVILWWTRNRWLGSLCGALNGGAIAAVTLALTWVLQPYQIARLLSFTNPEAKDFRSGVGFHLVQSKAAIGSGGVTGKGFMEGTQTQGAYVPEQSTDFVFSVIGEEWGFIGSIVVLSLFALLLIRILRLGLQTKHVFGMIAAAGTAGIYLVHVFINIGMVTGLLPVIGIPLPFISYGGSALLANTTILALVLNLHMRRDDLSMH